MRKTFFISLLALCFAASTWAVNVAKIGTTEYETLPAAVAAATNGQTVQLLGNVTAGPGVMIAKADAKQITIDFGGFTYCVTSPAVGSANTQTQGFHFEQGCVITMKNGTITSSGTEVKMLVQNYCDLTLENIVLDGSNLGGNGTVYTLSNNNGDVVIGNGAEVIARSTSGVAFDVCYYANYPSVHVTVKEGATINGKIEMSMSSGRGATVEENCELTIEGGEFTNFSISHSNIPEASVNSEITGGTFDAEVPAVYFAEGAAPVDNGNGTWSVQQQYVAKIGDTYFATLDEAVTYANANAGSEIVLLADIARSTRITLTANTTINLNGKTLSMANGSWLIFVKGGATLTIDGTTANSAVYGGISLGASTNNNGSLVLNGGSYSCGYNTACIHINGTCLSSDVTINGATLTNDYDNAIQFNGKGVFTIDNSTITGATGIYIKAGQMTITNSTVTGTMAPANYSYYGNGANATGDGIVVDACNYPGGAPTINIVSGTFSGTKSAVGNYNYQGTSEPAVGNITGGTYSSEVPEALCAEDYVSVTAPNAQGLYVVEQADYQRDNVTTTYGSLCLPKSGVVIGATVFEPAYKNGSMIFFQEVDGNRIEGGHGYLFQRKADYTKVSVKYDANAVEVLEPVEGEAMIGSYALAPVAADAGYAIIYNDKYYRVNSDNVYVRENGAYINLNAPVLAEAVPVPGRRYISFQDAAVNDITGVEEIEAAENAGTQKVMINGQLYILRDGQIYNVAGQVVK